MTKNYVTIMMKHLEQMQLEVAAAAESVVSFQDVKGRDSVYDLNRLVLVKAGSGTLHVRDRTIALTRGTMCMLLSGVGHRITVRSDEELTLQWCHFRSSYEDRDIYRLLQLPLHTQVSDVEEVSSRFYRLIEELAQERLTSGLRLKAGMLELISAYLEQLPIEQRTEEPSEDLQKINVVLEYIDDHLADNVTVEELARQVFLHPNYFIVFFKGLLGQSPIQYVNNRRMEKAKWLLLQPDCNVSAVASMIGMQIYYFSRMFKAHTGLTPSRYRKQAMTTAESNRQAPAEGEGK